jgi:hypothetical protein
VKSKVLPVVMAIGALAVSGLGCGSSDDGETVAAALTKQQFLARGNQFCKNTIREQSATYEEILKQNSETGSTKSKDAILRRLLVPVQTMIDRMSDLEPPRGDEKMVQNILKVYEEGLQEAKDNPSHYLAGRIFFGADAVATQYGLTECARF